MVSDSTEGLGVLLEGQGGGAPFLEELGEGVGGLAADHEEAGVEFSEVTVEVLKTLEKKSSKRKKM